MRKAASFLKRALAIEEQVYDANHPHVAGVSRNQVESPASLLIKACRGGDSESAASISISSLSKDLYDNEGNPLISWMEQHAMIATLEKVLALGWNPNLPNTSQVYPLHYGAMKNVAVARLLLQAGAHPFVQTAKESTPGMVSQAKSESTDASAAPTCSGNAVFCRPGHF